MIKRIYISIVNWNKENLLEEVVDTQTNAKKKNMVREVGTWAKTSHTVLHEIRIFRCT